MTFLGRGPICPGLKDRTLLERAEADGRLVLTLDKDF